MYQVAAHESNDVLSVGGTEIHYLDVGSGPALLLVHGLGHSLVAWYRNIEALRRSHRVIALDLPGYGLSACPGDAPYDPAYFASIIRRFVCALGLQTVDAVGCSAGGLSILLAALDERDLFRRLVLVDPVGFTAVPNHVVGDVLLRLFGFWQSLPANRTLIRACYTSAFYDPAAVDEETVTDQHRRRQHRASIRAARKAWAAFFNYSRDLAPLHERLTSLASPVLVVWGKNDRMFPVKDSAVAKRVLPRSRIEWLDRCGHCPQLERPDEFNALVLEFLNAS